MNAHRTGSLSCSFCLLQDVTISRASRCVQFIIHTNKCTILFAWIINAWYILENRSVKFFMAAEGILTNLRRHQGNQILTQHTDILRRPVEVMPELLVDNLGTKSLED